MHKDSSSATRSSFRGDDSWCDGLESAPAAVALPILGLLGGCCGEPVSFWLRDCPPDVAGAIQRLVVRHIPKELCCEVHGGSDLRRLAQDASRFALVIVDPVRHSHSLAQAAMWLLSRRRGARLPCLLLGPDGVDEAPGALLAVRTQPAEVARIRAWLLKAPEPDCRIHDFLEGHEATPVKRDFRRLSSLVELTGTVPLWRPRNLRSVETLRGLLLGRALLRSVLLGARGPGQVQPSAEDYASVYRILQSSTIGAPEESADPLLRAMVDRANLYLKQRTAQATGGAVSRAGREGLTSRPASATAGVRPITLRELADLGNPHSALLGELLSTLVQAGDRNAIRALGLQGRPFSGADDSAPDARAIRPRMMHWTAKQVRSRFDRLRAQGLVEGIREPPGNGPWFYLIPEEYRQSSGEFRDLPSPDHVARFAEPLT